MAEYIERESLLKDIENDSMAVLFDKTSAIHHIKDQPAADVAEVRRGKWIYNTDDFTPAERCSACRYNKPMIAGERTKQEPSNYCPNCDAKMVLGDDLNGG